MTTTTMHFGPEWMRTKGAARPAPSPPLASAPTLAPPAGSSTYSALLTPTPLAPPPDGHDDAHPFRYSKEEMLRIFKEGGGRGGLGIEVERWEGIVREMGYDPVGLKEMSDAEKKLFAGPLNSEMRRRQSTDFLSPFTTSGAGERPKLGHATSGAGSPMRERIGSFLGRRRGDSTDQPPMALPRKLSLSNLQGTLAPRDAALPSPRARLGLATTGGIDGVLNDTWSSRRRNTEGTKPSGGLFKNEEVGTKSSDLKEEDEETQGPSEAQQKGQVPKDASLAPDPINGAGGETKGSVTEPNGSGGASQGGAAVDNGIPAPSQPPPGLGDLSGVEWSYLDPQGQVQGPFKAEVMQRWFNEGYFTNNLLMKRTHLDTEWTAVGELVRRANGKPVFLTPLVSSVTPPGLLAHADSLQDSPIPDRHSPFQPVPTRTLRTAALDSYLQNGSPASHSPSSSFGGSRLLNGSPDPSTFEQRPYEPPAEQSRMPFATGPSSRRGTFNDPPDVLYGNRGLGSLSSAKSSGVDALGFGGSELSSATPRSLHDIGGLGGLTGSNLTGTEFGPIGGIGSNQGTPSRISRDPWGKPPLEDLQATIGLPGSFGNGVSPFTPGGQPYPQTPLSQFAATTDHRSLHGHTPLSERAAPGPIPIPTPQQLHPTFAQGSSYGSSPSPWLTHEPANTFRRPGPFDPTHPTSANTVVAQTIAAPPQPNYGRIVQTPSTSDQSSWFAASQGVVSDAWRAPSSNLTVANLGQHNEQQRQEELQLHTPAAATALPQPRDRREQQPAPQPAPPTPAPAAAPAPADPVVPTQKPRRKSAAQPAPVAPPAPKAAPPVPAPVPVPAPAAAAPPPPTADVKEPPSPAASPAEPKPVWATSEEDKKAKPSGVTLGLREIQEAEAKKAEARKAAERERERAARAANPPATGSPAAEFQPFTATWGLPTSHAGAARAPAAKDAAAASATPAPVWTNATKVPAAKKTMLEIQEEEEKRKKQAAKEKETIAAAARRAHAENVAKPATPAQPTGGAWTTVGAGGKSSAAAVVAGAAAARPATAASPVVKTAAAVVTPVATPPAAARPAAAAAAPRPTVIKASASREDVPVAPSLEFLKWLNESLKGLNSTANLEDVTSMLLSFPLDPDPSTVEVISDLIYVSSTTLDGRRFASEYVSKRKADAASRPKGTATPGKAPSIADVVKAQPKPAQNEWGGFKVVNKKKKGTKA